MIAFLNKYKWRVLYWLIIAFIVFYFAPKQSDYYLDEDIKNFKTSYIIPALIWLWIILAFIILLPRLKNLKNLASSRSGIFLFMMWTAMMLFIFQDIFLRGALFVNRLYHGGEVKKEYIAVYTDKEHSKNTFIMFDVADGKYHFDYKRDQSFYNPEIKDRDTIKVTYIRGLFGLKYFPAFFSKNE